jgi:phenylacetate-CoA ligase
MDELLLRVEADAATYGKGEAAVAQFRIEVERKLLKVLGMRTIIEVVAPGSIQRTDFKARRVIDDRKAFAEMRAQLEKVQT